MPAKAVKLQGCRRIRNRFQELFLLVNVFKLGTENS